jgi:hypothetical protein
MKYSRANHFLFSLILLLFINSANADRVAAEPLDDEGEVVRTLPDGHVHIINTLNTKIYFYLSYDGESWDEVDLDAKQDDIFELANYIKISTKKTPEPNQSNISSSFQDGTRLSGMRTIGSMIS